MQPRFSQTFTQPRGFSFVSDTKDDLWMGNLQDPAKMLGLGGSLQSMQGGGIFDII